MYGLYFSKRDKVMKIEKLKHQDIIDKTINGEVVRYNDYYYISNDKKLLRQKGKDLLQGWIDEAEKELLELQDIKIKG